MNSNENNSFSYSYSAKEQAELKKIREKYSLSGSGNEASKLDRVRAIDESVTKKAVGIAMCIGVIATLTMGLGMSLVMTELGNILGHMRFIVGIGIGFLGMAGVICAYPIYRRALKRGRKKIAPEILRLTDELINKK